MLSFAHTAAVNTRLAHRGIPAGGQVARPPYAAQMRRVMRPPGAAGGWKWTRVGVTEAAWADDGGRWCFLADAGAVSGLVVDVNRRNRGDWQIGDAVLDVGDGLVSIRYAAPALVAP